VIRWQVRSPIWNIPMNSKGGLEHVALVSVEFVPLFIYMAVSMWVSKNIAVTPHPYLIGPLCCLLFPQTKFQLWGQHFQDVPENSKQLLTVPNTGPKSQFHWCFLQLQKYWEGTTWKGTIMTSKKSKHKICYCFSPGTFGYVLVLSRNLSCSITFTILIACGS
jgi:hypothetical protein